MQEAAIAPNTAPTRLIPSYSETTPDPDTRSPLEIRQQEFLEGADERELLDDPNNPFLRMVESIIEEFGLPPEVMAVVVDNEEPEAFFSPSYQIILISKGIALYLLRRGLPLSRDHIAAILAHEIAHAQLLGNDYVESVKQQSFRERLLDSQHHSEEYRADAVAMQLLSAAGFNPRAMIEVLTAFGLEEGRGQLSHPEVIERVRRAEEQLLDDQHPLSHTSKPIEMLDPETIAWIEEVSPIYELIEFISNATSTEIYERLQQARTQQEFWLLWEAYSNVRGLELAKSLVEKHDEVLSEILRLTMFFEAVEANYTFDEDGYLDFDNTEQRAIAEVVFQDTLKKNAQMHDLNGKRQIYTAFSARQFLIQAMQYDDTIVPAYQQGIPLPTSRELAVASTSGYAQSPPLESLQAYVAEIKNDFEQLLALLEADEKTKDTAQLQKIKKAYYAGGLPPDIIFLTDTFHVEGREKRRRTDKSETKSEVRRDKVTSDEEKLFDLDNPDDRQLYIQREKLRQMVRLAHATMPRRPGPAEAQILVRCLLAETEFTEAEAEHIAQILIHGDRVEHDFSLLEYAKTLPSEEVVRLARARQALYLPEEFEPLSPQREMHHAFAASCFKINHAYTRDLLPKITEFSEMMFYRGVPDEYQDSPVADIPIDQIHLSIDEWLLAITEGYWTPRREHARSAKFGNWLIYKYINHITGKKILPPLELERIYDLLQEHPFDFKLENSDSVDPQHLLLLAQHLTIEAAAMQSILRGLYSLLSTKEREEQDELFPGELAFWQEVARQQLSEELEAVPDDRKLFGNITRQQTVFLRVFFLTVEQNREQQVRHSVLQAMIELGVDHRNFNLGILILRMHETIDTVKKEEKQKIIALLREHGLTEQADTLALSTEIQRLREKRNSSSFSFGTDKPQANRKSHRMFVEHMTELYVVEIWTTLGQADRGQLLNPTIVLDELRGVVESPNLQLEIASQFLFAYRQIYRDRRKQAQSIRDKWQTTGSERTREKHGSVEQYLRHLDHDDELLQQMQDQLVVIAQYCVTLIADNNINADAYFGRETGRYPYSAHSEIIRKKVNRKDGKRSVPIPNHFRALGIEHDQFDNLLRRRHPFSSWGTYKFDSEKYLPNQQEDSDHVGSPAQYATNLVLRQLSEELSDTTLSYQPQVQRIIDAVPYQTVVRDIYLEIVWRTAITEQTTPQQRIAVYEHIQPYFTNGSEALRSFAVQYLRDMFEQSPELLEHTDACIDLIITHLPQPSFARNYFLQLVEQKSPRLTPADLRTISSLRMTDQGKSQEKDFDSAPIAFLLNQVAELNRQQRLEVILWIIGAQDDKPLAITNLEHEYEGHADDVPSAFFQLTEDEQRIILQRFLVGGEGVVDLAIVADEQLKHAEGQRRHFLERLVAMLIIDQDKLGQAIRETFVAVLEASNPANASQVISTLLVELSQHRRQGQTLTTEEVITVCFRSQGVVWKKLAQSLAELDQIPTSYRRELRRAQTEGPEVPKRALLIMAESAGLIDGSSGIRILSFGELKGAASNKQVCEVEIEIVEDGLALPRGVYTMMLKVKRPSAQKIQNIQHDLAVAQVGLETFAGIIGDNDVPMDIVARAEDLVTRELDFQQEVAFSQQMAQDISKRNKLRETQFSVPIIIFANEDLVLETKGEGITLRQVYDQLDADDTSKGDNLTQESEIAKSVDIGRVEHEVFTELLSQIIITGNLSLDGHPGNFIVSKSGEITMIDLGMNEQLSTPERRWSIALLIGLVSGRQGLVLKCLRNLGLESIVGELNLRRFGLEHNVKALFNFVSENTFSINSKVDSIVSALTKLVSYKSVNNKNLASFILRSLPRSDYQAMIPLIFGNRY